MSGQEIEDCAVRHERIDADFVVHRLEEAGATLLALPATGYSTRLKMNHPDVVSEAAAAANWEATGIRGHRPVAPPPERITRMDEAFTWLNLIPRDRYVLRRIVGARALVSPWTERHLFSYRRLGGLLGSDHKAVQRWHSQGIDMIVAALRGDEMAKAGPRTVQDAIASVNAASKGRTRFAGQQPRDDELLVAEIERLRRFEEHGTLLRDTLASIAFTSLCQAAGSARLLVKAFDEGVAA